ncbi:sigma-70 family RNA polymerase sigma factor [Carboxylicivirga marina]|uniref:sigma-70 family RNA polymerase sigma factor n=1 Tax=Carboxylicivirga marina TaxID=2800988 RepID=UPI002595FC5B|nr:sigma-70 family RNA polymerase sigma factor [uncultured Carboxylicivirga sp.]
MNHQLNPDGWVDNYADILFRYALTRINKSVLAEGLVQETFLAGIKSSSSFKGESSELTWLTAILKRKIIDHYRKNSRKKELSFEMPDERFAKQGMMDDHWLENKAPKEWQTMADSDLENEELMNILQACIRHLPEKWALCFMLRVMDEMNGEEVCKELEISSSNMWVIMHRARLQLRDCVEKSWFK